MIAFMLIIIILLLESNCESLIWLTWTFQTYNIVDWSRKTVLDLILKSQRGKKKRMNIWKITDKDCWSKRIGKTDNLDHVARNVNKLPI